MYFDQIAFSLPFIQSGTLRALAVSWSDRLEVLPQVPSYAEASLPKSCWTESDSSGCPMSLALKILARRFAARRRRIEASDACAYSSPGITALLPDSPHSGIDYPPDFGHACALAELRQAEDTHVEKL